MNYDSTDSDFDADSSSITSQEVLVQCFICISLASIKFNNTKVCVPPPNEPTIFEQISQHGTSDDNTQPTPLPVSIKC